MRCVFPIKYANQGEHVADDEVDVLDGERVVIQECWVEAEKCRCKEDFETLFKPEEARNQKTVETLQRNGDGHLERLNARATLKPKNNVGEPAPLGVGLVRGIGEDPRIGKGMIGKNQRREKISVRDELQQHKSNGYCTVVRIQS